MRGFARAFLFAAIIPGAFALTGCADFDPTTWTDFFNTKKPLPGDRQAVFPQGVPGVPKGVPPELVKGNPASLGDQPAQSAEGAQPAREPGAKPDAPAVNAALEPKPKPKAKPKPRQVARPAAPTQPATSAAPAGQTAPWPDPPRQQAQQPVQPSGASANWPPPPAAGSFSR